MSKLIIRYTKIPEGFLGFYELNGVKFYCFWPKDVYFPGVIYTRKKYFFPSRKDNCYHITRDIDPKFNERYFEIHVGNFLKDTVGCIIAGQEFRYNNGSFTVAYSKSSIEKLFSLGDSFKLEFVKLT